MNKKYLSELLKKLNVEYEKINCIVSPVGSGKTHFIFNEISKRYEGMKLILVSTTSLKESMLKEPDVYTTKMLATRDSEHCFHIMTYYEFSNLCAKDPSFINNYGVIFCDEIHSMFEYGSYNSKSKVKFSIAIGLLFSTIISPDVFVFTATTQRIDRFEETYGINFKARINLINCYDNEEVVRHKDLLTEKFVEIDDLIDKLEPELLDLKDRGFKVLIFNERIAGIEKVGRKIKKMGLSVGMLWSINNREKKMSESQLMLRNELLTSGLIPNEYDVIIINGSMREGWNLLDNRVRLTILNTLDETNKVQARGRVRFDVEKVFYRVNDEPESDVERIMNKEKETGIISKVLGKKLTTDDKRDLSLNLNIKRTGSSSILKWTSIRKALLLSNYKVDDVRVTANGETKRVSIITKP